MRPYKDMAGGTAVLGGLVAGPALAVLGVVMGAKASKNLDAANANYAKAKELEEEYVLQNKKGCEALKVKYGVK